MLMVAVISAEDPDDLYALLISKLVFPVRHYDNVKVLAGRCAGFLYPAVGLTEVPYILYRFITLYHKQRKIAT